ncbi:hypothetical protein [Prochlorococcus sp. MIT 1223]|uniref:hypothetical protein n=1 Tax=Prochlorococcus sp. MIT 1223 TaxID=3096217 RepID=UPI002A75DE92|nr:hypothetical protein [Prochlorococcus sp. MIT 1223]
MPKIDDHSYLKICAELASCLSISLAAAKRKVELALASTGKKSLQDRKIMAEKLLKIAISDRQSKAEDPSTNLDILLKALAQDENFMIED